MAKRICCAVCIFMVLFLFSGCTEEKKAENRVITDFTADFTADYKEMIVEGSITATRQGVMNIKITSPDTLSGLEVIYKDAEVLISLGTLQCSADEAYLPKGSLPQLINSVMSGIFEGRNTLSAEDEIGKTYDLKTSDGNAVIKVNDDDFITDIEVGDKNLKISFYNPSEL